MAWHCVRRAPKEVKTSDSQSAWRTLTFSLTHSPAGATINAASGVFDWAVTNVVVPGTNSVTIRVNDNGVPPLADARTFSIFVQPLPQIGGVPMPGDGSIHLSFSSLADVNYQVEFKEHLSDSAGSSPGGVIAGTGGVINTSNALSTPAQFYRIVVLP